MAKVLNIMSHKGGTGKTTTAVNLAYGLAQKGLKGLCIDLDEQGNMTSILLQLKDQYPSSDVQEFLEHCKTHSQQGQAHASLCGLKDYIQKDRIRCTIYDVLMKRRTIQECIHPTPYENLDIVPYSPDILDAENRLQATMATFCLQDALQEIDDAYDFIILDNHPAENSITYNAVMAAHKEGDLHLLPIKVDRGGLEGIVRTLHLIYTLRDEKRNQLHSQIRLLVTMKNRNQEDSQWDMALHQAFPEEILSSTIRYQAKPVVYASLHKKVLLEKPDTNVARDYQKAVDEVYALLQENGHVNAH